MSTQVTTCWTCMAKEYLDVDRRGNLVIIDTKECTCDPAHVAEWKRIHSATPTRYCLTNGCEKELGKRAQTDYCSSCVDQRAKDRHNRLRRKERRKETEV